MTTTRIEKTLKNYSSLNLEDSDFIRSLVPARLSCSHAVTLCECSGCLRDKLIEFLSYETFFAVAAHQFLSQKIPLIKTTPIELVEPSDKVDFKSIEDNLTLAVVSLENALHIAEIQHPNLLEVTAQNCKDVYITLDFLSQLNYQMFFEKMIAYFRHSATVFAPIAEKTQLSIDFITDFVLLRLMGEQAKKYLDSHGTELIKRYPLLKDFLYSGLGIFSHRNVDGVISFYDEFFPNYDVQRVIYPSDHFASVALPFRQSQLSAMFKNTVFNKNYPIDQFIILADRLKDPKDKNDDSKDGILNYFLYPVGTSIIFRKRLTSDLEGLKYLSSGLKITVMDADEDIHKIRSLKQESSSDESRSVTVKLRVESLLTKEVRALTIHFFHLVSSKSLNLSCAKDFNRLQKLVLLSKETHIGVQSFIPNQCGILIFAFELAKYLQKNASKINSSNIHKAFEWILQSIRRNNPCFIGSDDEYLEAIKLAGMLNAKESQEMKLSNSGLLARKSRLNLIPINTSTELNEVNLSGEFIESNILDAMKTSIMLDANSSITNSVTASVQKEVKPVQKLEPDTPGLNFTSDPHTKVISSGLLNKSITIERDYSVPVAANYATPIAGSHLRQVRN